MGELVDDGGPQLIFVDEEDIALWVRVGPVYYGSELADESVVWVHYQSTYMKNALQGPIMLTEEEWDALDRAVRERFNHG